MDKELQAIIDKYKPKPPDDNLNACPRCGKKRSEYESNNDDSMHAIITNGFRIECATPIGCGFTTYIPVSQHVIREDDRVYRGLYMGQLAHEYITVKGYIVLWKKDKALVYASGKIPGEHEPTLIIAKNVPRFDVSEEELDKLFLLV